MATANGGGEKEQEVLAKQYNSNEQLLVMNLVGGDRNGSRKRIWSKRGGLWASWLGERVHRVVRTGLRRRTIQHMDITTCSVGEPRGPEHGCHHHH